MTIQPSPGPYKAELEYRNWDKTSDLNTRYLSRADILDARGNVIAGVMLREYTAGGIGEANAHLFATSHALLKALEDLLTYDRVERPAFRSKPMGAPGSTARIQQEKLIALEDAAHQAIEAAKGGAA